MSAIAFPCALTVLEICDPLTVYNVVIFCVVSCTLTSAGRFENVGDGTKTVRNIQCLFSLKNRSGFYFLAVDTNRSEIYVYPICLHW